jgi:nucleoside-triphosphatase THEP1
MASETLLLAAIVHTDQAAATGQAARHGDDEDRLVRAFCLALQDQGWRVGGIAQQRLRVPGQPKQRVQLVDLRTGQAHAISQDLGPLSQACCIDAGRVADASTVLRAALRDRVQLAVTNRFGELEAGGGGFAAEIAAFAEAGIPLLTVVARKHLDAWRRFTGGLGQELPADMAALQAWFAQVMPLAQLAQPPAPDTSLPTRPAC